MSFWDRIFHKNEENDADDLSIYRDEPSANRFASLLFGFFALFVTLLIAGGLFFGGRAVYRALNGSPNPTTVEENKDNNSSNQPNAADNSKSSDSKKSSSSSSKKPKKTPSTGDNITLPDTGDPGL